MKLIEKGLEQLCSNDTTSALLIEKRIDELSGLLYCYMDEIERFNRIYKLVKVSSRKELVIKHILDSLAPLGHIKRLLGEDYMLIADIGSGAGLPGIPLALCLPGIKITLIERMARRANFLRNTVAVLGLASRVMVEEIDLEEIQSCFDLVTLRALSPLNPDFTAKLSRLLRQPQSNTKTTNAQARQGGFIAAYKGRRETAQIELAGLTGYTTELLPVTVPFLDEERCLVLLYPLLPK